MTLHPTSPAAKYHSLSTVVWGFSIRCSVKGNSLDAEKWGRKICDVRMVPISTDNDAAPLSPFLNLSGAPATLDVGLCAANADVRVWNVLPPVQFQNAGEFVRMWRCLMIIPIKRMVTVNCDFTIFLPRDATKSAVLPKQLSVRLSARLWRWGIVIIQVEFLEINFSLTFPLSADPNITDLVKKGTAPNFSRNRSGVGKIADFRHLSHRISETVQDSVQVAIDH